MAATRARARIERPSCLHRDFLRHQRDVEVADQRGRTRLTALHLRRQRPVIVESHAVPAIPDDRNTMAGRLTELDAVPDDRLEVTPVQLAVKLFDDGLHELRAPRIDGHQYASVDVMI